MSILSTEEQALLDWLKSAIPRWLWMDDKLQELWGGVAKSLRQVQIQIDDWDAATFILTATDIWLNQHARDRGTFRQNNELDTALRTRLRQVSDSVTKPAVVAAVNAMLTNAGYGTCSIVELPKDGAFFKTLNQPNGTSGAYTKSGTTMTLQVLTPLTGYEVGLPLTLAGSTSAANNGTYTVTDIVGDYKLVYTNAAGVAESFPGTWNINKNYEGRKAAYWNRGYRLVGRHPLFIIILPYPTDAALGSAITETIRKVKAGGIRCIVERRIHP